VAAHAVYKWFPDEKRTLPTAILSQAGVRRDPRGAGAELVIVNHSGIMHSARSASSHDVGRGVAVPGQGRAVVNTAAMAAAETRIPYLQLLTSRTFIGCCAATFAPIGRCRLASPGSRPSS